MNALCHIYECVTSHINESRHTYEWVMSHDIQCRHLEFRIPGHANKMEYQSVSCIWMSHVTQTRHVTYEWVTSHRQGTSRMNESRHTDKACHVWMGLVLWRTMLISWALESLDMPPTWSTEYVKPSSLLSCSIPSSTDRFCFVCVYECVCVCVYTCACVCMYVYIYIYICTVYLCVCIKMYTYAFVYIYICTYKPSSLLSWSIPSSTNRFYVMHIYMCIYTYVYTHTCIHKSPPPCWADQSPAPQSFLFHA